MSDESPAPTPSNDVVMVGPEAVDASAWQEVIDRLDDMTFIVAGGHVVVVANRSAEEHASTGILGRACHVALHGSPRPCRGCPTLELLGSEPGGEGEVELPCPRLRASPLATESHGPAVLVQAQRPTTARTDSGEGERVLEKLFNGSEESMVVTDPDGTVLVFNEGAERVFGHEAEQVVGQMGLLDLFPSDEASRIGSRLAATRFGGRGRLLSCAATALRSDGTTFPVRLGASTVYDGEGELATLWFVRDRHEAGPGASRGADSPLPRVAPERSRALENLTARITRQMRTPLSGMYLFSNLLMQQLVRRELHRADAFLWNLIQGSVDAIIATDMRGSIFIFNDEAERILGYAAEELVGKEHITKLYPIEQAREVMRRLRSEDYGGKGKLQSHDMELKDKNGNLIPVRLKASIVYVKGAEFASVGFFHDQRERKKMEAELKRAQVQLLQSEKMASLGKLSAGIAHQINNPLSGIVLFSNLLLENEDLAAHDEWGADLRRIADDAERCSSIVKELLEFARQTQDKVKAVNVNRALAQTIFLLEKQPLFHNIEVVKELDESAPVVHGEPQQLNHVLMNLILNAAEAMEGRGTLTLRTRKHQGGELVDVEISDTGIGIPDDIRSRVFEPFFTTKEVGKGTGLGLSVVYGIVERHAGKIAIESDPGRGTTFTVTLPVGQAPAE